MSLRANKESRLVPDFTMIGGVQRVANVTAEMRRSSRRPEAQRRGETPASAGLADSSWGRTTTGQTNHFPAAVLIRLAKCTPFVFVPANKTKDGGGRTERAPPPVFVFSHIMWNSHLTNQQIFCGVTH